MQFQINVCLGCCTNTSKARLKSMFFENFSSLRRFLRAPRLLHSKFFEKLLILAFEANNALSRQIELFLRKVIFTNFSTFLRILEHCELVHFLKIHVYIYDRLSSFFSDQFLRTHMPLSELVFKGEFVVVEGDFLPQGAVQIGSLIHVQKSRFYQHKLDLIFSGSSLATKYLHNEVFLLEG